MSTEKTTITGLLIPADGPARVVELPDDGGYRHIAKAIGAQYIEQVSTPYEDIALIVDEEGRLTGRRVNLVASYRLYDGLIVGDALLFAEVYTADGDRDIASLTPEVLASLRILVDFDVEAVSA